MSVEIMVYDDDGPHAKDQYGRRLYRSYALVNFFVEDDEAALALMHRAERVLAELVPDNSAGVDAVFTDEVYMGQTAEPWTAPSTACSETRRHPSADIDDSEGASS